MTTTVPFLWCKGLSVWKRYWVDPKKEMQCILTEKKKKKPCTKILKIVYIVETKILVLIWSWGVSIPHSLVLMECHCFFSGHRVRIPTSRIMKEGPESPRFGSGRNGEEDE